MDRTLYLERWLLSIKMACLEVNLPAVVRALDFKGGSFVALELRQSNEALEIDYRKHLTGARFIVVATSVGLVSRLKAVHADLLRKHRRLLENGYRRFLKRSIRMLTALESAFTNDPGLMQRLQTAQSDVPEARNATPAALVRRVRGVKVQFEILPAAAVFTPTSVDFVAIVEKKLIEPWTLIPGEDKQVAPPPTSPSPTNVTTAVPTRPSGVELVAAPAIAAGAIGTGVLLSEAERAAQAAMPPPAVGPGIGEVVGGVLEGVATSADAVEVVATSASCLGDAACSAPDCSGIDLSGIDCGGIDCGGIG
jgi:hypothetical protein